jgi:hypothetical protein
VKETRSFKAPHYVQDQNLHAFFQGAQHYRAHTIKSVIDYLVEFKGLSREEAVNDEMVKWLFEGLGPLGELIVREREPVSHECVSTENDGNYMALCSVCLWQGPDRDSRAASEEDGQNHKRHFETS